MNRSPRIAVAEIASFLNQSFEIDCISKACSRQIDATCLSFGAKAPEYFPSHGRDPLKGYVLLFELMDEEGKSPNADGDFWNSLNVNWNDRRLNLDNYNADNANPRYGSSSAFASLSLSQR